MLRSVLLKAATLNRMARSCINWELARENVPLASVILLVCASVIDDDVRKRSYPSFSKLLNKGNELFFRTVRSVEVVQLPW